MSHLIDSSAPGEERRGVDVLHDGTATSTGHAPPLPDDLLALALGFLTEDLRRVEFLWEADAAVSSVVMQRSRHGIYESVFVEVASCDELPLGLTRRELDVVTLLVGGLGNGEIATALGVAARTVSTHVDHIMRKFDAPNRAAVATAALDAGVVIVPFPVPDADFTHLRLSHMARSAGIKNPRRRVAPRTKLASAPLRIGALIPLTGRARYDGREMLNGAVLALDELNARGGIHGREVVMDIVDVDADDTASVKRGIESLRLRRPDAITSGYLADQPLAMEAASIDGLPFLHASASSILARTVAGDPGRYRGVFQFCPNDSDYCPVFVDFVTALRQSGQWTPSSNRIAVLHQSRWDIVDLGAQLAQRQAQELGWEFIPMRVADRRYSESAWTDIAAQVRAANVAAVMIGSYFPTDHAQFLDAFLAAPTDTLVYSAYAPSVPAFRTLVHSEVNGLIWATTTGTYSDALGSAFAERYATRFGQAPGQSHAGIAYDRIQILAQAWGQLEDPRDFDAVAMRLAETRYRGVNGAYAFDPAGHNTFTFGHTSLDPSLSQAHLTFQIQDGVSVLIAPAPYAADAFRLPPWILPDQAMTA